MTTARGAIAALAVAVGLALPVIAMARGPSLRDPNDTHGPLDVRRVFQAGKKRPTWRVRTGPRWRAKRLYERGFTLVYLDTFGEPRADYYALIRSNGKRMRGSLHRDRTAPKPDRRISGLMVWRRDRRSVSVRVPLRKVFVPSRRDSFRWHVRTVTISRRCRSAACLDRAPDRGAIERPLEEPTPTPSPTG